MDNPTVNLRACYRILEDKVETTLRIRSGDQGVLGAVRDEVLAFMAVITEVRHTLMGKMQPNF